MTFFLNYRELRQIVGLTLLNQLFDVYQKQAFEGGVPQFQYLLRASIDRKQIPLDLGTILVISVLPLQFQIFYFQSRRRNVVLLHVLGHGISKDEIHHSFLDGKRVVIFDLIEYGTQGILVLDQMLWYKLQDAISRS